VLYFKHIFKKHVKVQSKLIHQSVSSDDIGLPILLQ
jgi:hypothetical protein